MFEQAGNFHGYSFDFNTPTGRALIDLLANALRIPVLIFDENGSFKATIDHSLGKSNQLCIFYANGNYQRYYLAYPKDITLQRAQKNSVLMESWPELKSHQGSNGYVEVEADAETLAQLIANARSVIFLLESLRNNFVSHEHVSRACEEANLILLDAIKYGHQAMKDPKGLKVDLLHH